jgi:hypothetical protein
VVGRRPGILLFVGVFLGALVAAWGLWHPLVTEEVGSVLATRISRAYFPPAREGVYAVGTGELDLVNDPLAGAIDHVGAATGTRIVIDWPTLEDANVRRDTLTAIRSRDLKLGHVLDVLLQETGRHERVELAHHLGEDGVIHVSTADAFAEYRHTDEIYALRDVVSPHFAARPARGALKTTLEPSFFERWHIDTVFRPRPADGARRVDALVDEIARTIDPPSWHDVGRSTGNLFVLGTVGRNEQMLVSQTAENHRRVAALLRRYQRQAAVAAFGGRTVALLVASLGVTALGVGAGRLLRHLLRRRHVEGRCAACGYDLRATPARCPECGVVPAG